MDKFFYLASATVLTPLSITRTQLLTFNRVASRRCKLSVAPPQRTAEARHERRLSRRKGIVNSRGTVAAIDLRLIRTKTITKTVQNEPW